MATKTVQDSSLTSIANAIRAKGKTSASLEFPTEFVSAIEAIETGGGGSVSVPPKDVNFYDYDGTIVKAYTASEFAALSAMPANPSHDGLTAQGWNWSLADAKAYVAKYGKLNIGQMYVTTSGDTEIDIQLAIGRNKPYLGCCPNGTVEIDWGDGSAHDTLTGTSTSTLKSIQHTYPDTGEPFTITLHMETGAISFIGTQSYSTGSQVLSTSMPSVKDGRNAYQNSIKAVRLGEHVTGIGADAFHNCTSLTSITIPETVTSIGRYALSNCYNLKAVAIPEAVTSISEYAFAYCYNLKAVALPKGAKLQGEDIFYYCYTLASVMVPEGTTSIGTSAFGTCQTLASVTIPETVTSIGRYALSYLSSLTSLTIPEAVTSISDYAFNSGGSLANLIFKPTTPPTVSNANAFTGLPSDLVVYVPAGTLADYQAATNYSSISSKMVEMAA